MITDLQVFLKRAETLAKDKGEDLETYFKKNADEYRKYRELIAIQTGPHIKPCED